MIWCKVDGFYVCRRCWEWECREGHGRKSEAVGSAMWEAAFGVLFFWCLAGFPGILAAMSAQPLITLLAIAVNLPFVAAWVWSVQVSRWRALRHAGAVRGLSLVDIRGEVEGRDESMPWRPNGGWAFRKRVVGAVTVAGIAAVLAAFIVGWVLPQARANERTAVGVLAGLTLGFLCVMPLWAALATGPRPTAMALTERGVHFWYSTPEERRLADGFVGWREIAYIGMRRAGKSRWRSLERKSGATDRPDFLTLENWNALVEEWNRRAPGST